MQAPEPLEWSLIALSAAARAAEAPREKGGRPAENSGQNVTSLQALAEEPGLLAREAPREAGLRTGLTSTQNASRLQRLAADTAVSHDTIQA